MSTASNMLNRRIVGLTEDGQIATGLVEQVSITDGLPKLHVGEHVIDLKNVSGILPESAEVTPYDSEEEP
jgi:hypothetical protein